MKNKGKLASLLAGITILVNMLVPLSAAASQEDINALPAGAVYAVDFDSKKVLAEKNADDSQMGIASMSKLLLMYIVMEDVANGKWSFDDEIVASDYATAISADYELSNVPLRAGESYTLRELFNAVTVYSANGAAIAIA